MLIDFPFVTLAVVPIVTTAGAALLPAIAAGLASVGAMLLNPKELFAFCRRKPHVPLLVLIGAAGLWFGGSWIWGRFAAADKTPRRASANHTPDGSASGSVTDWREVALAIIRNEERAKKPKRDHPTPSYGADNVPLLPKIGDGVLAPSSASTSKTPSDDVGALPLLPTMDRAPGIVSDGATSGRPSPPVVEDRPVILGRDASRCSHDGGPAPLGLLEAGRYQDALDPTGGMMLASPVVAHGFVFGASCFMDTQGSYGLAFCLDAETMEPRWEPIEEVTDPKTGELIELKGFFSSPAVTADGRYVIFGQGLHPDTDCHLICLEARSGRAHWVVKTPLHIESSPAIEGDMVVVGCGAIEDDADRTIVRSDPGYVQAVRISTGEEPWRHKVIDPESSPAIVDGIVYVGSGFNGCAIVALRSETDEELKEKAQERLVWRHPTPYPVTGAITVYEDLVLAGGGNGDYVYQDPNPAGVVFALSREDGKVVWHTQVDSPFPGADDDTVVATTRVNDSVLGAVAVRDETAICVCRTGEVFALDARTGEKKWEQKIGNGSPLLAGPAFTGRYVYAIVNNGYLVVLDAEQQGEELEKHYLNDERKPGDRGLCLSAPTVVEGCLYVGSETGGIWRFAGSGGRP